MNNTFEIKRFWFLIRKTLLERPAQITGLIGLMLLIIFILYFICRSLIGFAVSQNLTFIWGLVGGGCFLASYVFGYFASNAAGSSYLTLPASHFEKWLCSVLIVGILYPIIFLLFYRAMDASFVAFYHKSLDPTSPLYKDKYKAVYQFAFDGFIARKVYSTFALFTGVGMVGSLYFNKANLIKTALVFCAICLCLYCLNWLFAQVMFGSIEGAIPFQDVYVRFGDNSGVVPIPRSLSNIVGVSFGYVIPAILWILAYLRLKEKEF